MDRLIRVTTKIVWGGIPLHLAVVAWVQTGHDVPEPYRAVWMSLIALWMLAGITLKTSLMLRRY